MGAFGDSLAHTETTVWKCSRDWVDTLRTQRKSKIGSSPTRAGREGWADWPSETHREPAPSALLTPWSWTSSHQTWETINVCCGSHPLSDTSLWCPRKQPCVNLAHDLHYTRTSFCSVKFHSRTLVFNRTPQFLHMSARLCILVLNAFALFCTLCHTACFCSSCLFWSLEKKFFSPSVGCFLKLNNAETSVV